MKFLILLGLLLSPFTISAHDKKSDFHHPMFDLMNFTSINQPVLSTFQAIEASPIIVRGTIEKITPGRHHPVRAWARNEGRCRSPGQPALMAPPSAPGKSEPKLLLLTLSTPNSGGRIER